MNYLESPVDPKNKHMKIEEKDGVNLIGRDHTLNIYEVWCKGKTASDFIKTFTIEVYDGLEYYQVQNDMIIFIVNHDLDTVKIINKNIIAEMVITFKKVKGEKSK